MRKPGARRNTSGVMCCVGYLSVSLSLVSCSGGMSGACCVSIGTGGSFGSVDKADLGTIICCCKFGGAICAAELELGVSVGSGTCTSEVVRWSYHVSVGGGAFVDFAGVPFDVGLLRSAGWA